MSQTAKEETAAAIEALVAALNAGLGADEIRIAREQAQNSEEYATEVLDLPRAWREVRAKRDLIAVILAEPHEYIPGDEFYSCSQAVDPYADRGEDYPGSGCSDDGRRGNPCDCGRDGRVERMLKILAGIYEEET